MLIRLIRKSVGALAMLALICGLLAGGAAGYLRLVTPGPSILSRHIAKVDFDGIPLGQALDDLGKLAHTTLTIDRPAFEQAGVHLTDPVYLKLHDVDLETAFDRLNLRHLDQFVIEQAGAGVRVTALDRARVECTVVDLSDLVPPPAPVAEALATPSGFRTVFGEGPAILSLAQILDDSVGLGFSRTAIDLANEIDHGHLWLSASAVTRRQFIANVKKMRHPIHAPDWTMESDAAFELLQRPMTINAQAMALHEALTAIADATGANVVAHWDALAGCDLSRMTPVGPLQFDRAPAELVLTKVMGNPELVTIFTDRNTLVVTSISDAAQHETPEVFDISQTLHDAGLSNAEEQLAAIQTVTRIGDTWINPRIQDYGGRIWIRDAVKPQRELRELLRQLDNCVHNRPTRRLPTNTFDRFVEFINAGGAMGELRRQAGSREAANAQLRAAIAKFEKPDMAIGAGDDDVEILGNVILAVRTPPRLESLKHFLASLQHAPR